MKLICHKNEKLLYLYADGLLETAEHEKLLKHISECTRCAQALQLLRQSGAIISQAKSTDVTFLSHDAVNDLVTETLTADRTSIPVKNHTTRWVDQSFFPRFAITGSAVLTVLFIITALLFRGNDNRQVTENNTPQTEDLYTSQQQPPVFQDASFSWLNKGCAVKTLRGSQVRIIAQNQQTVKLDLYEGELLVAGIKGLYDTIEVRCVSLFVRAMGTRFSMLRMNDTLDVHVLEGAVLISNPRDSAARIGAGYSARVDISANKSICKEMDFTIRNYLLTAFSGFSNFLDSTMYQNDTQSYIPPVKLNKKSSRSAPKAHVPQPTDKFQYMIETAERFLRRQMWHACINTLDRYLEKGGSQESKAYYIKALALSKIGKYEDAVKCFRISARDTTERILHEAASHFANRLQFGTLRNYQEAKNGINEYLTRYPDGKFAVFERYYLIETLIANGENDKALLLMQQFVTNYPDECPSRRYRKILTSQRKDSIIIQKAEQ